MTLRKTRQMDMYLAIKELSEEHTDYPISEMCRILDVNRAAYYKWKNHSNSENDELNERIAEKIMRIHDDHPDMCIWRRPTAGFAEQNGRDAERAAAQNEQLINIFQVLQDLN